MRGRWRWGTLTTVWSFTAVASGLLAIGGPFPPLLTTGLYLGTGRRVVVCYAELARAVSHRVLRPLVVGNVFYSVGAVLNLLRWPVLWPGLLGGHELFHPLVLRDSLAHYRLMLQVVVPFETRPDLQPTPPLGTVEPEESSLSRPAPTCTPVGT